MPDPDIDPCDIDAVAEMIDDWNLRFTFSTDLQDGFIHPSRNDIAWCRERAISWYKGQHDVDATLTPIEGLDKYLRQLVDTCATWSLRDNVWAQVKTGADYKHAVRLLEWRPGQESKHWVLRYTVTRPEPESAIELCIDKVPLIDSDTGETFYGDWQ